MKFDIADSFLFCLDALMKYKQFLMFSALSAAISTHALAAPTIKPAGIQIVWNAMADEFDGFGTYGATEGVSVSLVVQAGAKSIIGFDDKKSKVAIHYGDENLGGKFGSFEKYSKDRKNMRVDVKTKQLPSDGSGVFKVTGSMEVVVASKKETKSIAAQKLKKGDKLTLKEGFNFEVSKIGKPKYGQDELEIDLKWKGDIPELAEVKFYNKEGALIESRAAGWSSFGRGAGKTVVKTYKLKKKFDEIKIEMDLWTDAEALTLPIDLQLNALGK